MKCSNCGREVSVLAEKCPDCGKVLHAITVKEHSSDGKAGSKTTTRVVGRAIHSAPQSRKATVDKNSKLEAGILCGLFLSIIGLIPGLLLFQNGSTEQQTFRKGWRIGFGVCIILGVIIGLSVGLSLM